MHRSVRFAATALHQELRTTLEEASQCYTLMIEAGEHPNLDRMGYASQITLDIFRRLLDRPDLQVEELAATLREAMAAQKEEQVSNHQRPTRIPRPFQAEYTNAHWPDVMASFLAHHANQNLE